MPELTISLSPEDLAHAAERVARGEFADTSSFVGALVRADREALSRLLSALDEGEASGVSELTFEQIIEQARGKARSRAA